MAPDDNNPYIVRVVVTVGSTRTTIRRKIWIPGKKYSSTVDLIVDSFIIGVGASGAGQAMA